MPAADETSFPVESPLSSRERDYVVLIGARSQRYYLRHFRRFDDSPQTRHWTWNGWAFFFTGAWLAYRGLQRELWWYFWLTVSAIIAGIALPPTIVWLIFPAPAPEWAYRVASLGSLIWFLLCWLLPSLLANHWLHQRYLRVLAKADESTCEPTERAAYLRTRGSPDWVLAIFVVLAQSFMVYVGYASVSTYKTMTQRHRASAIEHVILGARREVDRYYVLPDKVSNFPIALTVATANAQSANIHAWKYDPAIGEIAVSLTTKNDVQPLSASLTLRPEPMNDGKLRWHCTLAQPTENDWLNRFCSSPMR
jgi:hypothetical protein